MSAIYSIFAVLLLSALSLGSARPSSGQISVESLAFRLGQSFGGKSEVTDVVPITTVSCRRRVTDALAEKLRSAGFFIERPFLAQLADDNLRDKICRLYALESQSLVECLIAEAAENGGNPPLLRLLEATCDIYNNAIQLHAECITEIERKMERECAMACSQQFSDVGEAADRQAEFDRAIAAGRLNGSQAEGACRVGLCAVRCVNTQLGECESEAKSDVVGVEQSALIAFYDRVNALQLLAGLESTRGADVATRLIKNGKLPRKCQAFARKATDEEPVSDPAHAAAPLDEPSSVKSAKFI